MCVVSQVVGEEPDTAEPFSAHVHAYVNTAKPAAPDAQEVVLDLPSARHWSRHQRGQLGPWTYIFYPDGTGKIMDGGDRLRVMATLTCQPSVSCDIRKPDGTGFEIDVGEGELPEIPENTSLDNVSIYLAKWLLAGTAPPPPPPPPPPPEEPEIVPDPDLEIAAAELVEEEVPDLPVEDEDPEIDPESAAAPLPDPPPVSAEDEPVCSEPEPFLPMECAQPTEPLPPKAAPAAQAVPAAQPTQQTAPAPAPPKAAATPDAPPKTAKERFLEKYKLNCSFTTSSSMGFLHPDPDRRGIAKPRASLGCSAKLSDKLSVRTALLGFFNPKEQASWDPDYTYAFTYRYNDNLSFGYSNYSARFSSGSNPLSDLLNGKLRASYKLPAIKLPNDKTIPCTASAGLPRPTKESLNLSCGYAVTKKLRVSGSAYFYMPGEQGTYQPDYSYTASYRFNDDWLLSYNNYSNNRWPWNKGEAPGPGIYGGSLSLTYKFKF